MARVGVGALEGCIGRRRAGAGTSAGVRRRRCLGEEGSGTGDPAPLLSRRVGANPTVSVPPLSRRTDTDPSTTVAPLSRRVGMTPSVAVALPSRRAGVTPLVAVAPLSRRVGVIRSVAVAPRGGRAKPGPIGAKAAVNRSLGPIHHPWVITWHDPHSYDGPTAPRAAATRQSEAVHRRRWWRGR